VWEHYKLFDLKSQEDVREMSLEEFNTYEDDRMKKNVSATCKDLASRVQDSPGPKGTFDVMSGFTSAPREEMFYTDGEYFQSYIQAPKTKRSNLPGHGYFSKVLNFFDNHFEMGELYMEYIRGACSKNGLCEYCREHPWFGPVISRAPRPMPGPSSDYLTYDDTPTQIDGKLRLPDDYQPRTQLKVSFASGEISSVEEDKVKEFAQEYCVAKSLVQSQLAHLEFLDYQKKRRQQKCKEEAEKKSTYDAFDWHKLFKDQKIIKLKIIELDLYLTANKLSKDGNKADKVSLIEAHIARIIAGQYFKQHTQQSANDDKDESDVDTDSDMELNEEERIMNVIDSNGDESDNSEIDGVSSGTQLSRYGRRHSTWQSRQWFGD